MTRTRELASHGSLHSGFGIDRSVVLAAGDTKELERVAQHMLRCPFSLARLIKLTRSLLHCQGVAARLIS